MTHSARSLDFTRRQWLRLAAAGIAVGAPTGWLKALAADAASSPQRKRSCILLWMNGGPSQMDTFDLKPGHANGGPFKAIQTSVTGVRISEHLPKLAQLADHLALVRSMSTKEGDHGRASYFLRTGYMPQGQVRYPTLGSLVAKELADEEAELPSFVSIAPYRFLNQAAYGPGFLGHEYAPLIVGESNRGQQVVRPGMNQEDAALRVKDLDLPDGIVRRRADARLSLLEPLNSEFIDGHPVGPAAGHRSAIERAVKLMRSDEVKAFHLDAEQPRLRDGYGRNPFGQGCLLARRLIERGVPFVEVTLNSPDGQQAIGWDTHAQNFDRVRQLSEVLDAGWSTLIRDLHQRGLLETTAIVWMGEFGRTPKINANAGRDHFPTAWTTVLAGGGINGGRVICRTSADGMDVEDRPVSVPDFIATVCLALGIDPKTQNVSNVGRPIRIVDTAAKPITEALS
jgi:Protein of unknown function (DUF1501)